MGEQWREGAEGKKEKREGLQICFHITSFRDENIQGLLYSVLVLSWVFSSHLTFF